MGKIDFIEQEEMEESPKEKEWSQHFVVRGYYEFKNYYWGVFCKHTGKRYGQGERSVGSAARKANRIFKKMQEKVDLIILGGDNE